MGLEVSKHEIVRKSSFLAHAKKPEKLKECGWLFERHVSSLGLINQKKALFFRKTSFFSTPEGFRSLPDPLQSPDFPDLALPPKGSRRASKRPEISVSEPRIEKTLFFDEFASIAGLPPSFVNIRLIYPNRF